MATFKPVFPTSSSPPQSQQSIPSSLSSTSYLARQNEGYFEKLAVLHSKLSSLQQELSPEDTPISVENVNAIRRRLLHLLRSASYDPSNAKWTHVACALRMISTSRRYVGVAPGVRMGEEKEVEYGNYEFVLPETQEEWERCERKWENRFQESTSGDGKASKYFQNAATAVDPFVAEPSSRAERLRDKVKKWQATVVPGTQGNVLEVGEPSAIGNTSIGKEKGTAQRQSPLPFPVVKHMAHASAGKAPATGSQSAQPAAAPKSSRNGAKSSSPIPPTGIAARIQDVSEMVSSPVIQWNVLT